MTSKRKFGSSSFSSRFGGGSARDFELETFSGYRENLGCLDSVPRLIIAIFVVLLFACLSVITATLGVQNFEMKLRQTIESRVTMEDTDEPTGRMANWKNNSHADGALISVKYDMNGLHNYLMSMKKTGRFEKTSEMSIFKWEQRTFQTSFSLCHSISFE
jgi:hypothetical protein